MAKRNGGIIGPSNAPTGIFGTAKGVWKLRDAFNYIKAGTWPVPIGYQVENSLRFNSGSSDSLTRTPASAGNRQIWTWSGWIKKTALASRQNFFQGGNHNAGSNSSYFEFSSGDVLRIAEYDGAAETYNLDTTQVFRDVSAFYHIVIAFDTTQATASNRVKLYVNGNQVTSFSTANYPSQNSNTNVNNTVVQSIGRDPAGGYAINGYLAETYLIDGQQLTPSSFGETDSATGIWTPKAYTGTYGTNGFYLPFETSTTSGFSSYYGSFNGTTQSLSVTNSTEFNMGTGNFTVEGFFKFDTVGIWDMVSFLNAGVVKQVFYHYGDELAFYDAVSGFVINPAAGIKASTWYHIAWVENSNTFTIYLNGNALASATSTSLNITGNTSIIFGKNATRDSVAGQISNLRIVKGTAVYTSNFTPPNAPLTNVSGTSLLTLQDATIIDNSSNAFSITNTGSVATTSSSSINSQTGFANDFSGNNNNFTANNLTSIDQTIDTPTNNFCTLNPLDTTATNAPTFSNGNLSVSTSSTGASPCRSTFSVDKGKWYWEIKKTSANAADTVIGIMEQSEAFNTYIGSTAKGYGYISTANKVNNSSQVGYGASYTSGDIIGVALDMDNGTLIFYKNGVSQGTAYSSLSGLFSPAHSDGGTGTETADCNFGYPAFTIASGNADANGFGNFEYAVPSGYYALCTKNLAIYG